MTLFIGALLVASPLVSGSDEAISPFEPDAFEAPLSFPREVDVSRVLHVVEDGKRLVYLDPAEPSSGETSAHIQARLGDVVALTVINRSDVMSDLAVPAFDVVTPLLIGRGASATLLFDVDQVGEFAYGSTFADLQARGLTGKLTVRERSEVPPVASSTRTVAELPE